MDGWLVGWLVDWLVCSGVKNGVTAVEARAPISATQLDGVVGLAPMASAGLGEGEGRGEGAPRWCFPAININYSPRSFPGCPR